MVNFILSPGMPRSRRGFRVIFACLRLSMVDASCAATQSAAWVLSYEGKSTNAFIWDKRAHRLVKQSVPAELAGDLLAALGGPPDPVRVVDRRYLSVSACVAHACMVKGFFWIDSQSGVGLGVKLSDDSLTLGSSGMLSGELPLNARQAIIAWLSENDAKLKTVQFVSRSGQITSLTPTQFSPSQKYRATPQGPSFDCRKATTAVEKTICGHTTIAKLDFNLATLVSEIRQGHDNLGAQDQLRLFQREWLKNRDATCTRSSALANCLEENYRQQYEKLMNWVPTQ